MWLARLHTHGLVLGKGRAAQCAMQQSSQPRATGAPVSNPARRCAHPHRRPAWGPGGRDPLRVVGARAPRGAAGCLCALHPVCGGTDCSQLASPLKRPSQWVSDQSVSRCDSSANALFVPTRQSAPLSPATPVPNTSPAAGMQLLRSRQAVAGGRPRVTKGGRHHLLAAPARSSASGSSNVVQPQPQQQQQQQQQQQVVPTASAPGESEVNLGRCNRRQVPARGTSPRAVDGVRARMTVAQQAQCLVLRGQCREVTGARPLRAWRRRPCTHRARRLQGVRGSEADGSPLRHSA